MPTSLHCPECAAPWLDDRTCETHFHQMLFWETEYPAYGAEVHHLTVLCYYLQHPSLYSPAGLDGAQALLLDFLEGGLTPQAVRQRDRARLASDQRDWAIKGRPEAHGQYAQPVAWTMTAPDVTADGPHSYCDRVHAWARATLAALRESGNLPAPNPDV